MVNERDSKVEGPTCGCACRKFRCSLAPQGIKEGWAAGPGSQEAAAKMLLEGVVSRRWRMESAWDDSLISLFLILFIYLFLERGERREKERERNIDVRERHQSVASCMCPDWGLNTQPKYVL